MSTLSTIVNSNSAIPMEPERRHHCEQCGKTYGTVGHLNRHMRVHTGERPYRCNQCPKSFMRKDHLDDHSFSHTSHRPFPCTRCNMKFGTKQKLQRHEALHDQPKQYACEHCSEAFTKKNQLARHRVQHTGKLPFPCPEPNCEKAFSMPSALKRHREHRHSLSTYVCMEPSCNADPFTKFSQLQRHLKLHCHLQSYECDECGKRFRNSSSLNKHKPIHELPVADRLIHKCHFPGCKAAYTSSGNLGTHVRSRHLNREAFVCESCNARFSLKSTYERHRRNLHGDDVQKRELRFICRVCNARNPSRAALRRHMRVDHKMSVSQNSNVCKAIARELSGTAVCQEEEERARFINVRTPLDDRAIGVPCSAKGDHDDMLRLEATTGGTAVITTEVYKEFVRREREAADRHEYAEASRELVSTFDGTSNFGNQQSTEQRLVSLSDAQTPSADVALPIDMLFKFDESQNLRRTGRRASPVSV